MVTLGGENGCLKRGDLITQPQFGTPLQQLWLRVTAVKILCKGLFSAGHFVL